jgi:hypothetical protein
VELRVKLKVPKLDWKGKALKLRTIVLAGAPLVEIDREVLDMFEVMRKIMRAEISEDAVVPTFPVTPMLGKLMWEPYSDAKGNEEFVYGWHVRATLYCTNAKPWWLVRANNKLDEPPARSIVEIERVVDCLGADVQRDRIMNCSFGGGRGYSMWWTWLNQLPLLEMQIRRKPFDIRHVQEGSPLPTGYERVGRAHTLEPKTGT